MTFDWKRDLKRVLAVLFAALLMSISIKTFVRAADLFPGASAKSICTSFPTTRPSTWR